MITREEYWLLKEYQKFGYEWITRDKNGKLYTYQEIPRRYRKTWNFGGAAVSIQEEYLTFIKWEDETPTSIADLINEYEAHQLLVRESEKVKIPPFVADWIVEMKNKNGNMTNSIYEMYHYEKPKKVYDWVDAIGSDNGNKLVKAMVNGYEIEKEKLYTVRLANGDCLCRFESVGIDWTKEYSNYEKDKDYQLTQSEIESIDPILMQIAKLVGK